MTRFTCHQAEIVAGAIALGEATATQRDAYRLHIASCDACLQANGGEIAIENTMVGVTRARDTETWDPDMTRVVRDRIARPSRVWRYAFSTLAVCVALVFGAHLVSAGALKNIAPSFADPLVVHYDGQRLVLEKRSVEQQAQARVVAAQPRVVVVHNVVNLDRVAAAPQRVAHAPRPALQHVAPRHVAYAPAPVSQGGGEVPVWRQGGGAFTTVSHTTTTTLNEAGNVTGDQASIVVAPAYAARDAAPVGGETAISPQPPMIAYAEGAQGTTVFKVFIDAHGMPTKCTITKSSGYLSLDNAVCHAAMAAKYTPHTVNGKPEPGTYLDAFTFRTSDSD